MTQRMKREFMIAKIVKRNKKTIFQNYLLCSSQLESNMKSILPQERSFNAIYSIKPKGRFNCLDQDVSQSISNKRIEPRARNKLTKIQHIIIRKENNEELTIKNTFDNKTNNDFINQNNQVVSEDSCFHDSTTSIKAAQDIHLSPNMETSTPVASSINLQSYDSIKNLKFEDIQREMSESLKVLDSLSVDSLSQSSWDSGLATPESFDSNETYFECVIDAFGNQNNPKHLDSEKHCNGNTKIKLRPLSEYISDCENSHLLKNEAITLNRLKSLSEGNLNFKKNYEDCDTKKREAKLWELKNEIVELDDDIGKEVLGKKQLDTKDNALSSKYRNTLVRAGKRQCSGSLQKIGSVLGIQVVDEKEAKSLRKIESMLGVNVITNAKSDLKEIKPKDEKKKFKKDRIKFFNDKVKEIKQKRLRKLSENHKKSKPQDSKLENQVTKNNTEIRTAKVNANMSYLRKNKINNTENQDLAKLHNVSANTKIESDKSTSKNKIEKEIIKIHEPDRTATDAHQNQNSLLNISENDDSSTEDSKHRDSSVDERSLKEHLLESLRIENFALNELLSQLHESNYYIGELSKALDNFEGSDGSAKETETSEIYSEIFEEELYKTIFETTELLNNVAEITSSQKTEIFKNLEYLNELDLQVNTKKAAIANVKSGAWKTNSLNAPRSLIKFTKEHGKHIIPKNSFV